MMDVDEDKGYKFTSRYTREVLNQIYYNALDVLFGSECIQQCFKKYSS